ncbi:MAG TPA: DUF502 domain-containing protein [Bacteroidia bacterium]|jgi:uncharacterized membrane protein|nr:DUF502 domain-containing protein [Bacteroidia bacterium]
MKKILQSRIIKNFISHFAQGLIVIAPTVITVFVFYRLFIFFRNNFPNTHLVNPYLDPVIIIVGIILLIFLIGRLSATIFFTPVMVRSEKVVERVPFIRVVYSAVKDLFSAFIGNKKKFNRPVLVTIDKANDIKQIGFVTQTDLSSMDIAKDMISVYLPFSYGLNGKLIIIHKDSVQPLDVSASEAMKFIVSGGVTHVD